MRETKNLRKADASLEMPTEVPVQNDGIIDIVIPEIQKQRFRINGNPEILELNTSDMGIINRLETLYAKLDKLAKEASAELATSVETGDASEIDEIVAASKALQKIDTEMRKLVDDIFDAPVSRICAPYGTMFDPKNGEFRFEHIIKKVSELYDQNLSKEFDRVATRMKRHTSKYTGK